MVNGNRVYGVALVGRRLADNDNLGLAYLQAAMDQADILCHRHTVNGIGDLDAVANAITRQRPSLIGLSLSDGGSAPLLLALGELLRARGFTGHITCGGPFATLARDWLLQRYRWIDSIVRHAGEAVLPELVHAVAHGSAISGVPGVTTREGDGTCSPIFDRKQVELRPHRDELSRIVGHRAAHILGSRGCQGRCAYCGPASLQQLERKEAVRAGWTKSELDRAGIGRVRRRPVDSLCEEIAELWHGKDVRYFYFVDEHLLPYDEPAALTYLTSLRRGLADRHVGALGIGTMLRADRISPSIVDAFASAGLVRLFLGIEFGTEAEARTFGRKSSPDAALDLFDSLDRAGVAVVSNLMLLHPESTPASIRAGIEFLSRVPSGVFETTRMMVYHGTRLWERMRDAGRLTGNPLRYGYAFEDPVVERFSHIFTRLRAEAFWDHSIAYRTHDAFLALALARKVASERIPSDLEQELDEVRRSVNALYVETYSDALTAAESGADMLSAAPLVMSARQRSNELVRRLERCTDRLSRQLGTSKQVFSPMRAAAAGAISFVMLAAAPSCGGTVVSSEGNGSGQDAGTGGSGGTGGTGGSGGTAGVGGSGGSAGTGGTTFPCTPDVKEQQSQRVRDAILQNDACFSGDVEFVSPPPNVRFRIPFSGQGARICDTPENTALVQNAEEAARAALVAVDVSCLWPEPGGFGTYVDIHGGAEKDANELMTRAMDVCPELWNYSNLAVLIDPAGKVAGITSEYPGGPPIPAELEACILKALDGLTFPCLGGYAICPEYVIAE